MCLRLPLKNVIIPWSECHIAALLVEGRIGSFDFWQTHKSSRFSLCVWQRLMILQFTLASIRRSLACCKSYSPLVNCVPCPSVVRGSLVTVSLRALDTRLAANQSWVLWALANERPGQLSPPGESWQQWWCWVLASDISDNAWTHETSWDGL